MDVHHRTYISDPDIDRKLARLGLRVVQVSVVFAWSLLNDRQALDRPSPRMDGSCSWPHAQCAETATGVVRCQIKGHRAVQNPKIGGEEDGVADMNQKHRKNVER